MTLLTVFLSKHSIALLTKNIASLIHRRYVFFLDVCSVVFRTFSNIKEVLIGSKYAFGSQKVLHLSHSTRLTIPAFIYLSKFNNRNSKKRCEICSMLKTKTSELCHWFRSSIFIVKFEHISHLFDFEQVDVS